jgi:hypothetical protein
MTSEQFFRAFLASLRVHDLEFVDTRNDRHHKRFQLVVDRLRAAQKEHENGAEEMPRALVSSPFTGRYQDFDDALVRLQRGLLGSQNPFYPGIRLTLSKERAERILNQLPKAQHAVIEKLADIYLGKEKARQ